MAYPSFTYLVVILIEKGSLLAWKGMEKCWKISAKGIVGLVFGTINDAASKTCWMVHYNYLIFNHQIQTLGLFPSFLQLK
jgi:hypothetical protein